MFKKYHDYIKESISFNENSEDVKELQQALVDSGINIGSFGENGDGIDGIAGRFTFGGVKVFMEMLKDDIDEEILKVGDDISDKQVELIKAKSSDPEIIKLFKRKKKEIEKQYKDILKIDKPSREVRIFIDKYSSSAVEACEKIYKDYGVKLYPSLMLAQAAVESGWGKSSLTRKYNNFFGIKASKAWEGKVIDKYTYEEINGKRIKIKQPFRWYDDPVDSFYDRNKFLLDNKRYKNNGVFKAESPIEQAEALQRAGYATASNYAKVITSVIYKYGLDELDKRLDF